MVCLGQQGWQTDFGADLPFGDSNVNGMGACPDGSALFLTSDGMLGFDGKQWKEYPTSDVSSPVEFACNASGDVWISGYSGVAHLDGEAWTEFPIEQILDTSEVTERPKGIALSQDGTLWLALDHSLARYQNETWTFYRKGQGFNQEFTFVDVVVDSNSKAWAAYQNGLLTQQGDGWKQINLSSAYNINTLAIDDQDRIWAGATKNLWVYNKGQWKSYNLAQGGKSDENVLAVAVDDQGRAWAGTHWGLNVVDEKGKITTYHMHTSELKDNRIDQVIVLGGGPPLPDLADEPPGAIRGKFTMAGQPLVKARVEVCMSGLGIIFTGATPCTGEPGFKSTTTDENGEFVLE